MGTVGDVRGSGNLILDFRDALHDAVDSLTSLHGVGDPTQHQIGLKLNEVYLMILDIFSEVRRRMVAGKAIRVVAIRQEEHLYVHLLLQQHIGSSQCSVHTGIIAIIKEHDVAGESMEQPNLVDAQGSTRVCHHILDSALVHGNHIGVSLHHVYAVFLGYRLLCLIKAIEFSFLMVNLAIWRVDVFLAHALGAGIEHSSTESHHLATHTEPWEDGTPRESIQILILPAPVVLLVLIHLEAKTGAHQVLRIVSLLHSLIIKGCALRKRESQLELPDDVVAETTTAEILHTDGTSVHIILKNVLEILRSPIVDDEHGFPFTLTLLLLAGHLPLLYLDVILLGKPAKGIGIGHLLQLHQEVDGISALAASKAMADTSGWRHGERRMGIVMERTESDIVDASLLERDKLRHHLFYLGGVHNTGYGRFVYHVSIPIFIFLFSILLLMCKGTIFL